MNIKDPVELEIVWSQLVSIVDEMAASLIRTAFSIMVREANDFACVLMDAHGRSLVQSTRSVPSFAGVLPLTARHFFHEHPPETLRTGDVLITNDPWMAAGHLPDTAMIVPVYQGDRIVAFVGTVAHLPDIGGRQLSADATEVFEEGIRIPISKLYRAGEPNQDLFSMLLANVRVPDLVKGDLEAQVGINMMGSLRLLELMADAELADLEALADAIHGASEAATRQAIADVPDGEYCYEKCADGFGEPVRVMATVRVHGSAISVDYTGSSPQSHRGINSVENYTYAYTVYPLKCVFCPEIPNNEGCMRPFTVTAPLGSILNPRPPAAVGGRALTGHLLPDAVMGALAQAVPERVTSQSGAPPWLLVLNGRNPNGQAFADAQPIGVGTGARPTMDGLPCLTWPSNASSPPIEIVEHRGPVIYRRKALLPDSGGAGRYRGGLGQEIIVEATGDDPLRVSLLAERLTTSAEGIAGGLPGSRGHIEVNGTVPEDPKAVITLQPGDRLNIRIPGGGGYGDPSERDSETLARDIRLGRVSLEVAQRDYGVKGVQR